MRKALLLPLVILLAVTSCASYTVERGLEGISTPTYAYLPPTKLATIQDEADRIAQEEAKRQAEAEAIRQAEEASRRRRRSVRRKPKPSGRQRRLCRGRSRAGRLSTPTPTILPK